MQQIEKGRGDMVLEDDEVERTSAVQRRQKEEIAALEKRMRVATKEVSDLDEQAILRKWARRKEKEVQAMLIEQNKVKKLVDANHSIVEEPVVMEKDKDGKINKKLTAS